MLLNVRGVSETNFMQNHLPDHPSEKRERRRAGNFNRKLYEKSRLCPSGLEFQPSVTARLFQNSKCRFTPVQIKVEAIDSWVRTAQQQAPSEAVMLWKKCLDHRTISILTHVHVPIFLVEESQFVAARGIVIHKRSPAGWASATQDVFWKSFQTHFYT